MKLWYKSKTVWGGSLLALAGLITAIAQILLGEFNLELFLSSVAIFLKGLWDIYNRFKTSETIAVKKVVEVTPPPSVENL